MNSVLYQDEYLFHKQADVHTYCWVSFPFHFFPTIRVNGEKMLVNRSM